MTEKSDPVRDAVTEARRAQILEAAVDIFSQKGFDKATVKDVAQKAGVADGTIYNYFKNKTDLLTSMIADFSQIGSFTTQAAEINKDASPEELIRFIVRNRLELMEKHQTRIQAVLPQVITNTTLRKLFFRAIFQPAVSKIEEIWRDQADRGNIRDVSPEVLVRSTLGLFFGLAFVAHLGDPLIRENTDDFLDQVIDLMLNGILPKTDSTDEA